LAFVGTIVSERTPFIKLQLNWPAEVPSFKLKYDISVAIAENQILATVTITSGDVEFHTLRNLTEQSIRSIVDVVGYYVTKGKNQLSEADFPQLRE